MGEIRHIFLVREVSKVVIDVLERVLNEYEFDEEMVDVWKDAITSQSIRGLRQLGMRFHFKLNCSIVEKISRPLNFVTRSYFDYATITTCIVQWENNSLRCLVIVYGRPN